MVLLLSHHLSQISNRIVLHQVSKSWSPIQHSIIYTRPPSSILLFQQQNWTMEGLWLGQMISNANISVTNFWISSFCARAYWNGLTFTGGWPSFKKIQWSISHYGGSFVGHSKTEPKSSNNVQILNANWSLLVWPFLFNWIPRSSTLNCCNSNKNLILLSAILANIFKDTSALVSAGSTLMVT